MHTFTFWSVCLIPPTATRIDQKSLSVFIFPKFEIFLSILSLCGNATEAVTVFPFFLSAQQNYENLSSTVTLRETQSSSEIRRRSHFISFRSISLRPFIHPAAPSSAEALSLAAVSSQRAQDMPESRKSDERNFCRN